MIEKYYAEVALPIPVNETFYYRVPPEMIENLAKGKRVTVAFHGRILTGLVVGVRDTSNIPEKIKRSEIKEILDIIDKEPLLGDEELELGRWIAEYYLSSWGVVLSAFVPVGKRRGARIFQLSPSAKKFLPQILFEYQFSRPLQTKILELLNRNPQMLPQIIRSVGTSGVYSALSILQKAGLVEERIGQRIPDHQPRIREVLRVAEKIDWDTLVVQLRNKAPRQLEALLVLREQGELTSAELVKKAGVSTAAIKALEKKNLVVSRTKETFRFQDYPKVISSDYPTSIKDSEVISRIEQAIAEESFRVFLLPGGNFSRRADIYLPAIARVIKRGKQAIVLVPEIALTSQTVERFQSYFGAPVAVLHSGLSSRNRSREWWRLKKGEAFLTVGTRSAVFAPLKELGLVIIDEEHEHSYKQAEDPKYNAREVALWRARKEGAIVILGSPTPSVESYYHMEKGIYQLLSTPYLEEDRSLTRVKVVDMRKEFRVYQRGLFSTILQEAVLARIRRKEPLVLFLNRRGFSTVLLCRECGLVVRCPRCNVALVYHLSIRKLRCHYCNYMQSPPRTCPRCQGINIGFLGAGTQKLEEEVKAIFPGLRVARMDTDTVIHQAVQEKILQNFRNGEYDVLVGTQMIAKVLDFPIFTLIGVISADTGLNFPDFRAAERTFQLLTGLVSRAAQGAVPIEVIIQTYNPDHYSIQCACTGDYVGFYSQEIKYRQQLGYPPFRYLIAILIQGDLHFETSRWVKNLEGFLDPLRENSSGIVILGPAPATLHRLQGKFRWQILLLGEDESILKNFCRENILRWKCPPEIRISIDVDPVELM